MVNKRYLGTITLTTIPPIPPFKGYLTSDIATNVISFLSSITAPNINLLVGTGVGKPIDNKFDPLTKNFTISGTGTTLTFPGYGAIPPGGYAILSGVITLP